MADNKDIINCPACGKVMKKVFVPSENFSVDICTEGCGGILFDNRELEKFDEKHENIDEILKEVEGKSFNKVDDTKLRICPICEIPMTKLGAANGDIKIDVCNVCGAKFLDHGELTLIREKSTEQDKTDFDYSVADTEALGSFGTYMRNHIPSTSMNRKAQAMTQRILNFLKSDF